MNLAQELVDFRFLCFEIAIDYYHLLCCFKCFCSSLYASYTTNITDPVYYKFSSFYSILVLYSSKLFPISWNLEAVCFVGQRNREQTL